MLAEKSPGLVSGALSPHPAPPLPLTHCSRCWCIPLPGLGMAMKQVLVRMLLFYPASSSLRMEPVLSSAAAPTPGSASSLQLLTCSSRGRNFPRHGQTEASCSSETARGSSTGPSCLFPGWKTADDTQLGVRYPQRGHRPIFLHLSKWALAPPAADIQISQLGFGLGFLLGFVFSFLTAP